MLIDDCFTEIDDLCATVEAWDTEILPLSRMQPGDKAGAIAQTGDADFQYMYAEFSVGYLFRGAAPPGLITFNIQEPTRRHYWWRGHDLNSAMVWVFPQGGELHSVSAPGFCVHTISATEERVAEIAASLQTDLPTTSKRRETFEMPATALTSVRGGLNAIKQELTAFPYRASSDLLYALVGYWLGCFSPGNERKPSIRARDRAIRKGLEIINEYDMQMLTTETLLEECNVSERTLQYAFRESFSASPAAFLKSLRLARARYLLRRARPDQDTVGDIAAMLGIWHLGQFAADYRKLYGERPSETLSQTWHNDQDLSPVKYSPLHGGTRYW